MLQYLVVVNDVRKCKSFLVVKKFCQQTLVRINYLFVPKEKLSYDFLGVFFIKSSSSFVSCDWSINFLIENSIYFWSCAHWHDQVATAAPPISRKHRFRGTSPLPELHSSPLLISAQLHDRSFIVLPNFFLPC